MFIIPCTAAAILINALFIKSRHRYLDCIHEYMETRGFDSKQNTEVINYH